MRLLFTSMLAAFVSLGAVCAASELIHEPRSGAKGNSFSSLAASGIAALAAQDDYVQSPNFRGSTAIRISHTAHSARWSKILAEDAERYFNSPCDLGVCKSATHGALTAAVKSSQGLSLPERLAAINGAVNRAIIYTSDQQQYIVSDHWAAASETMTAGRGDCEDIAILKMWLLRAAGVPAEAIHLVLVKDTRRGLDHAILVVKVNGSDFVLDNVHDKVLPAAKTDYYTPLVSLAANGAWIHGRTAALGSFRTAQRR